MRTRYFILFVFFISNLQLVIGQINNIDSGFTNKSEAKDLKVNGLKEGKWFEYLDSASITTTDTNAPYYCLRVYKSDKIRGLEREYYKSGKIRGEFFYTKSGSIDGISKTYYENGKIMNEAIFIKDTVNVMYKAFYENGNIEFEVPFINGKENGVYKHYTEDGVLSWEINYTDGKMGERRDYDKNGNEVK